MWSAIRAMLLPRLPRAARVASAACVAAAACGLHCAPSAEAARDGTDGTATPPGPAQEEEEPTPAGPRRTAPKPEPFAPQRLTRSGGVVTSSYEHTDGTVYSTGIFAGSLDLAGVRLVSKGGDDVFVAKWNEDGTLAWALAAGSPQKESAPNIGTVAEGRVSVVGMTEGQMDCGSGPLPIWTSETFFFCAFGTDDGVWLAGGTFPTGAP
jgi:hypothetical protein